MWELKFSLVNTSSKCVGYYTVAFISVIQKIQSKESLSLYCFLLYILCDLVIHIRQVTPVPVDRRGLLANADFPHKQ